MPPTPATGASNDLRRAILAAANASQPLTMPRQSTKRPPSPPSGTRHEDDFYAWVNEQVALLRAGRIAEVDAANIAEELSDMGKSEFRALCSALSVLLQHLLKWDHQPARRSRSWEITVRQQRRQVARILRENPGLRSRLSQALSDAYEDARDEALLETNLADDVLPEQCPYLFDDVMERPIVFEPPARSRKRDR